MKAIDYIFISLIVAFCFYGICIGIKTIYNIRKNSINDFKTKREQKRKELHNDK